MYSHLIRSNQSNLTACSNDYNFEEVFLREYRAFSKKEDTLIAISTSGNSKNIIQIINYATSKNYNWILIPAEKKNLLLLIYAIYLRRFNRRTKLISYNHLYILLPMIKSEVFANKTILKKGLMQVN